LTIALAGPVARGCRYYAGLQRASGKGNRQ
jgi:hypothetical protein